MWCPHHLAPTERDQRPDSPVLASTLKMIGSCRGPDDEARLAALQGYARELGLEGCVEWHVNVPYGELKQLLGGAVGGLHTMLDEHFGISVVEYMAADGWVGAACVGVGLCALSASDQAS